MSIQFFESNYKYTDPIRYFKANDPYYYEVDNIPLKQLQENCNFLKDQVGKVVELTDINLGRDNFTELKPVVYGIDNKVYVNPGRYTARINDAYSITPLQKLRQLGGFSNDGTEYNDFRWSTTSDQSLNAVLQRFRSNLASDALGANGLYERFFTYYVKDQDRISQFSPTGTAPGTTNSLYETFWPNVFGTVVNYANYNTTSIGGPTVGGNNEGFFFLPAMDSMFIKRWRGVTRTAIVDVPETLSIEVPPFNPNDFFYKSSTGQNLSLSSLASQRIDLLFIYSKPIDMSSVTISKWSGNQPITINRATLGILRGAGIGVNLTTTPPVPQAGGTNNGQLDGRQSAYERLTDADGNPIMLPSLGDFNNTNMGFSGVKGSFPSPDDLLNISPLLAEQLETKNISMIGQSILPIAYIVVKESAQTNSLGEKIITEEDVIDIRPFFRTTELSYSERAGIAAAMPQISLVNPVATENYVDHTARLIRTRVEEVRNLIPPPQGPSSPSGKLLWAGLIKGGLYGGVEGVLADRALANVGGNVNNVPATFTDNFVGQMRTIFGYPSNITIDELKKNDWDIANFTQFQSMTTIGHYRNDRIWFAVSRYSSEQPGPGPYDNNGTYYRGIYNSNPGEGSLGTGLPALAEKSTTNFPRYWWNVGGYYSFVWTKKEIGVVAPSWAKDIRIEARYFNCSPIHQSIRYNDGDDRSPAAKSAGIFVTKYRPQLNSNYFQVTIYSLTPLDLATGNTFWPPAKNRSSKSTYNSYVVINSPHLGADPDPRTVPVGASNGQDPLNQAGASPSPSVLPSELGNQRIGLCAYPTVEYEIYAIPDNCGIGTYFNQPQVGPSPPPLIDLSNTTL